MALKSGSYTLKVERNVVVWPAPDVNGDGKEVWSDHTDAQGRMVGRSVLKDANGREIRSYFPPDGFANRPGYDHTDNYVKVDERGEVVRQPNGEAIGIKPGQALVFEPDGSVTVLEDEYSQYVFRQAHDAGAGVDETEPVPVPFVSAADKDAEIARLHAELAKAGLA